MKELIEIIRCKDCQGSLVPVGKKKCKCDIYKNFGSDDFYCAFAVAREDDLKLPKLIK